MRELSLDPAARERYGVSEWIPYDVRKLSAREMATIQVESRKILGDAGYSTPGAWIEGIRRNEPVAVIGLVWSTLRRAGVEVAYADVDFDILALNTRSDEPEPSTEDTGAESGKGDATGDAPQQTSASPN